MTVWFPCAEATPPRASITAVPMRRAETLRGFAIMFLVSSPSGSDDSTRLLGADTTATVSGVGSAADDDVGGTEVNRGHPRREGGKSILSHAGAAYVGVVIHGRPRGVGLPVHALGDRDNGNCPIPLAQQIRTHVKRGVTNVVQQRVKVVRARSGVENPLESATLQTPPNIDATRRVGGPLEVNHKVVPLADRQPRQDRRVMVGGAADRVDNQSAATPHLQHEGPRTAGIGGGGDVVLNAIGADPRKVARFPLINGGPGRARIVSGKVRRERIIGVRPLRITDALVRLCTLRRVWVRHRASDVKGCGVGPLAHRAPDDERMAELPCSPRVAARIYAAVPLGEGASLVVAPKRGGRGAGGRECREVGRRWPQAGPAERGWIERTLLTGSEQGHCRDQPRQL